MRCRVTTCQGIGDLLWVYKKLEPHYDDIEFEILVTGLPQWIVGEQRSLALFPLLPRCTRMDFRHTTLEECHRIATIKPDLPAIFHSGAQEFEYAVNAYLEAGTRLDAIDQFIVSDHLHLAHVPERGPQWLNRICLYPAASRRPDAWPPQRWARVAYEMCIRLGCSMVAVVGAEYDASVAEDVMRELRDMKHQTFPLGLGVMNFVGSLDLRETLHAIRSSRLFIGLQSGLSVLADNYGMPQMSVDYDKYKGMGHTWATSAESQFWTFGQLENFPYEHLATLAKPAP